MEGLSERQYAARVGLSRGAIQKAKATGRLVLHGDGSIDAVASDALRAEATDPSKTRKAPQPKLKPVPEAAVSAVGETLGGVSNLVEILRRRSPSMGIWA